MKILKIFLGILIACALSVSSPSVSAKDQGDFSGAPVKKSSGEKWRIGYYEGGEYTDYQKNFMMTIKGLMELGWIRSMEIPPQEGVQTKDLWKWLNQRAESEYIDFVGDAHYSASWDEEIRKETASRIIERLNRKGDIDLMLALGTWAGLDLANNKHHVPVVVMATANPLQAGIIKSIEDSGYDHVHARVDPYRHERQVRIFHDIIGFDKLGVVYEDTPTGRTYSAMDEVERISKEKGFEIVRCIAPSDIPHIRKAEESVKECFHKLAKEADAIYVPVHGGITPNSIPELVEIANSYKIPTFSLTGSVEVEYGFLMSIATAGFKYAGRFYARTIAKILNGAKARELPQLFEDPPKIAINLKTAEIIDYSPPVDVLAAADEIYQDFRKPDTEE